MNENFRVKGFLDPGDLYNHLSYKKILKGYDRDAISGEEGYTSEFYNKFKNSVYGQLMYGPIKFTLLGEYRVHQDSVVLLKVMREDGLQGIVDIQLNTIIPLKYCAIKMIELDSENVLFITDKIEEEQLLHSLYTLDGCIIENATEITPTFTETIEYDAEDKTGFVGDMTFSMQKKKRVNQVLLNKRYSIFENKIIRNLVENADAECENDTIYDYQEESHKSLYSSLQYASYRTKKKSETKVDVEVVIDVELLKKGKGAFVNRYSSEHKLFPFYFSNQIFKEEK